MPETPFLADVDRFLAASRMAESAFGRAAVNDWKFISQLRAGRRVWPETEAKVRKFMASYRPANQEREAA